jgi:outer membrane protein assembly factor BamD (BamD/ComL family)
MKHRIKICLLLAALLLAGLSCTPLSQKKSGVQRAGDTRKPEIEEIISKAGEYVAKGDFKSAHEFLKDAAENYAGDGAREDGFTTTVEDIKKAADKAFEKGDFTLSGRTYYLLLKSVPQLNGFPAGLSFTKKGLTARLGECSSALSQRALTEYRSGNIENAISLWKGILSFDPGNKTVKKFINTATTQLKNLKQKN